MAQSRKNDENPRRVVEEEGREMEKAKWNHGHQSAAAKNAGHQVSLEMLGT